MISKKETSQLEVDSPPHLVLWPFMNQVYLVASTTNENGATASTKLPIPHLHQPSWHRTVKAVDAMGKQVGWHTMEANNSTQCGRYYPTYIEWLL